MEVPVKYCKTQKVTTLVAFRFIAAFYNHYFWVSRGCYMYIHIKSLLSDSKNV